MKTIIAFVVLIAGISALPKLQRVDFKNERLVSDSIASAIQDISRSIKEAGLDPLDIQSDSGSVGLPVPVLFNAEGVIEKLLVTGLSEIVINNINYSVLLSRFTFDIELPSIQGSLEKADLGIVFFGNDYSASASGSFGISRIRVSGNVRVSLGIISGISIRSVSIDFSLGGIESALNVRVQNWDLSSSLNTFLGTTIPTTLNNFSSEINELLEIIVAEIAEGIL